MEEIFLLGILLPEPCISLIYAWKTHKYTNHSFSLSIMYGSSYLGWHPVAAVQYTFGWHPVAAVQYTFTQKQYTEYRERNVHNNKKIGKWGLFPVFASYTLVFALKLRKSTEKPQLHTENPKRQKTLS
jgi:hypothetical protein